MKKVAGTRCRSSMRRMRSTPTRGPKRRSSSVARLRFAFSGSRERKPDSASKSNEKTTAHCLPSGHVYRITGSLQIPHTRVEHVPQAVAEQIEREDADRDDDPRGERDVGRDAQVVPA